MIRSTTLALALAFASLATLAADEPAPIAVVDGKPVYGAAMPEGEPTPIGAALAKPEDYAGKPRKFSGRVAKVCQKKGCWMVLASGEQSARVMFGRDDFFIPKDSSGEAIVHGTLTMKAMSEAEAKHMAQDGGQDPAAVSGPRVEAQISATSVMLVPTAG
ncbi:MAG: DUF4920 domain-containing protein [Xanthomonadales bacterium]|nr:hypothetical protein [Xanthomonadales bacterium]MCC6592830.1 DUF4920 domain-containing protein [Xanthomonadales bacterium]MCE7931555.1 DUF4920 domain-containing protein [Xanthomonadales bacterium PRO6]